MNIASIRAAAVAKAQEFKAVAKAHADHIKQARAVAGVGIGALLASVLGS